jgi:hypothetical protein
MLCLCVPSPDGREIEADQPIVIVGRTIHCHRIECAGTDSVRLLGAWLHPGQQALVPLHSVRSIH